VTTATVTKAITAPGTLVRARGREWVVQPGSTPEFLLLQPLGGGPDDIAGVFPDEGVTPAAFPPPSLDDVGDSASTNLLRTALRIGFSASAGPFRSLARLSVSPRSYQYVPLLMALRQDTVRLLIADDVGIGKTIEAGLIAAELLTQGSAQRLAVLCSPALAEQWQRELHEKFGLDAALVLTSTVKALERGLMLNESLFDRYPYVIISSDFIKTDRRRHEFLLRCPELVIVDEAHNYVAGGGQSHRSRHQRYELLQGIAADPQRHLIMATATPHSGDEEAFTNLIGLCNPQLRTVDLSSQTGRGLLARHFVQRRRGDIRSFLDEDTPFPHDRETRDVAYALRPAYRNLFDDVLAYAREQVHQGVTGSRGKVRWWSALALLRAMASSPRAAAATLRTRAEVAELEDESEIDALGRAGVLDSGDEETLEGIDATPGSVIDASEPDAATPHGRQRRRLLAFARRAAELAGPDHDRKLAALTSQLRKLLADGYAPIVFCRFIHTADYVAEHLKASLGTARSPVHVEAVTGQLPPAERERRVQELAARQSARVLVATDCLSEGVNLQENFSAVVHYDLAWNPTRHEQREGRVDRFGQRRDIVRALTLYGEDNGIDGIVLDVLIRKHRAIAKATGVAVPVPGDGGAVIDALAEGLLLRQHDGPMLPLDLGDDARARDLDEAWFSAAEKEKLSRTRYAQHAIKPDEVAAEVAEIRAALGTHGDIEQFALQGLRALGAVVTPVDDGYQVALGNLPQRVTASLPISLRNPLPLRSEPPAARGESELVRTDPTMQALARYVLESALDPAVPAFERPARRSGVMRTAAVPTRTTIMLVRLRFQMTIPFEHELRQMVAEDARVLAFEGPPERASWLPDGRAEELLVAVPSANVIEGAAHAALSKIISGLTSLGPYLDEVAEQHAARLLSAHRRVRAGSGAARRGLTVTAQRPVDVLSVQVLLPEATG
jgi:superfamily II DNA or RNA helicase